MRRTLPLALMLATLAGPAAAETVTVTTTLAERGFADGFLLSGRQASSLYLPLPADTEVSNVRIGMKARAVAPNLQRGSVVISVNGQPVDALRLAEDPRARIVTLDAVLNEGGAFRASALDLRFRADLIAHAEFCTDEFDPADSLQVLPETTVTYDIDLDAVQTLADALALLPGTVVVEIPETLTPEIGAAALKLSAALANKGYRASFGTGAEGPVALRIVAGGNGAIALVHEGGRLRVDVPADADLSAFSRLWQAAPGVLAGAAVTAESPNVAGSAPSDGFWPFPTLPAALRVIQTGELGLDFPMLDVNGRRASQAKLRLTVAPDWSDARPVITIYLNGQLITASRAEIGENIIEAPLPVDLLRLSNRLTVAVDRAQVKGYCPGPNPGHAVQLLTGSGIDYDDGTVGGFAAVAGALRSGGTLVLPADADGAQGKDYLGLAARVLSGLGVGAAPINVSFAEDAAADSGAVISIAPAMAEGLLLPIAINRGRPDVQFSADQPLASMVADATRARVDIKVLDVKALPDPAGIYLGNSGKALVSQAGVIWQDTPTGSDPSLVRRARDASLDLLDVLRTEGVFWGLIAVAVIAVTVLARALLKRYFGRRAAK